jgi:predicted dinucleotide-binding enzyme
MKIAVLGAGAVGSTTGRLWHAAGHDVTFAARHATRPRAPAAELGERAHAAPVADAVAHAEVVLLAVPALAVTDALQAASRLLRQHPRLLRVLPGRARGLRGHAAAL